MELPDTSAWTNRHKDEAVRQGFDSRVLAGEMATCAIIIMELLWTTQSPREFARLRADLGALPQIEITPRAWERAIEVWNMLVLQGHHRQVKQPDLLVAAAAELAGLPVCHYDADFQVIAAVTGQPERVIAPIGSL